MSRGRLSLGGIFTLVCRDKNTGKKKWETSTHNIITDEGLDHILDVVLHGTTPVSPWYCLIFETNTTPLAAHTYASPGFTESTAYDEATRPEYEEAASSSQITTNSANKASFTINDSKTIYGAALVSDSTKDDQAAGGAVLLASGLFSSSKVVADGDVLELTYTISSADDGA